jgi:hypothetical protein
MSAQQSEYGIRRQSNSLRDEEADAQEIRQYVTKVSPRDSLPNHALLDQGDGAPRRRARHTRAGRAALGGRPGAARRARQATAAVLITASIGTAAPQPATRYSHAPHA